MRESRNLWERVKLNYGYYSNPILRKKPFIKLINGEFAPPYTDGGNPNVFLPSDGLPISFNIISPELIQDDTARKFIEELGIKEPDKIDYIRNIVLPKYNVKNCNIKDDEIIKDFEIIYCQYLDCKNQDSQEYIEEINENLLIVGEIKGQKHLYKISEVYNENKDLKKYFENNKDALFISIGFYQSVINKYGKEKIVEFLNFLNFLNSPKIVATNPEWHTFPRRDRFKNVYEGHNGKIVIDYDIDGLSFIARKTMSFDHSVYLWRMLTRLDRKYFKAECKYWPDKRYSIRYDYCESLLLLRFSNPNHCWIYDKDNQPKKPNEIFREDLHEKYERNEGTEELLQLLGIKSRPKTEEEKLRDSLPIEMQQKISLGEVAKELFDNTDDMKRAKRLLEDEKAKELAIKERKRIQDAETNRNNQLQNEQRKRSIDEMFEGEPEHRPNAKNRDLIQNNQIEKLKERQEEELAEKTRIEELKAKTEGLPKYCAEWFNTLLELEYLQSGEERYGNKGISITFNKVEREGIGSRIFVLRNPSRYIPTSLEEIGGLEITFKFKDTEDLTIGFEVANVREYTLRVKAKLADEIKLNSINLNSISRAIVNTNNPIQLIEKLRTAFNGLRLEDSFCLKQNLPDNIHFIFGPPGTGKTTSLAKKWINGKMATKPKGKMLILTPTNKACDVLLEKTLSIVDERSNPNNWLFRFVATSNESLENYVCERSLDIRELKKICVILTIARFPYDGFQDTNYNLKLKDIEWDYIIIDEASMIPLAQIIFTIYQCPNAQFIIAGDPFQIDPIVHEPSWSSENIYTMVNLKSFATPKLEPKPFEVENLETQYRSLPAIGEIFSEYSYDGKLKHYRTEADQRPLKLDNLGIKTINYIPFKVERYDSIFGAKRLSSSNVHIYSVLLSFEFTNYLVQQIKKNHVNEKYRIGIICPYAAQAQLIDKLWEQRIESYENVEILVGTIHGFQGDECDIIIAVFNPPIGLKGAADKVFLNKQNIINVAISRAHDYLFILLPDKDTDGFENLFELKRLGRISNKQRKDVAIFTSNEIENVIFKDKFHIENNTFVTTHQLANVYTQPTQKYEVRIDENAVDIQLNLEIMFPI